MSAQRSGLQMRATRATLLIAVAALACALVAPALAQDRADIDRTQIIGNRELPKVLYIVPWKKPLQGDLSGRPLGGVLDEALAPVDRDVFRRQVRFGRAELAAQSLHVDVVARGERAQHERAVGLHEDRLDDPLPGDVLLLGQPLRRVDRVVVKRRVLDAK